jgi:hypothetical protein
MDDQYTNFSVGRKLARTKHTKVDLLGGSSVAVLCPKTYYLLSVHIALAEEWDMSRVELSVLY